MQKSVCLLQSCFWMPAITEILQQAFQIRSNCDYSDFFIVSKRDAEEQYENAEDMVHAIEIYLQRMETG